MSTEDTPPAVPDEAAGGRRVVRSVSFVMKRDHDKAVARAEAAEAKLAEIEAYARAWAESAAATEWSGTVLSTTVLADAGRTILAIIGTEEEADRG